MSKAALHALTIATASELRGKVAVNALSPGWVKTDMAPDGPGDPRWSAEGALAIVTGPAGVTGKLFHRSASEHGRLAPQRRSTCNPEQHRDRRTTGGRFAERSCDPYNLPIGSQPERVPRQRSAAAQPDCNRLQRQRRDG